MNKIVTILFICILCTVSYSDVGKRHSEKEGGFSFCAPKGWQFREFPGFKYQISVGPAEKGFAPNINVVDESFDGSIEKYVDANIVTMEALFKDLKIRKRDTFSTSNKLKGERLVITSLQQGNVLRQTFYFFEGSKGKKLVITCSCLSENGESFDEIFEESLKTFQVIK